MQSTHKQKYDAYLKTEAWRAKKKLVRKRAGGICERCDGRSGFNQNHEVHHYTYKNLFCEHLEDLGFLCVPCHEFLHGLRKLDPLRAPDQNEPDDSIEAMRARINRL